MNYNKILEETMDRWTNNIQEVIDALEIQIGLDATSYLAGKLQQTVDDMKRYGTHKEDMEIK